MKKEYRVYLHTRGGMYAQYDGHVDVYAENDEAAEEAALLKLRNGAFPDYSRDMWRIDRVERRRT